MSLPPTKWSATSFRPPSYSMSPLPWRTAPASWWRWRALGRCHTCRLRGRRRPRCLCSSGSSAATRRAASSPCVPFSGCIMTWLLRLWPSRAAQFAWPMRISTRCTLRPTVLLWTDRPDACTTLISVWATPRRCFASTSQRPVRSRPSLFRWWTARR